MKNYTNTIAISKPLYLASNQPDSIKAEISSLANYKDIRYPYKGSWFFSVLEDSYYRVNTLADGYLIYSTNTISPTQPVGTEYVNWEKIVNIFIGTYSLLFSNSGGGGSVNVTIASTPATEVNTNFNTAFSTAGIGDIVIDIDKSAEFMKYSNTKWLKRNVTLLGDTLVVPDILDAPVQPFK